MSKDKTNENVYTIYVNSKAIVTEKELEKAVGFALSLHKASNLVHVIEVKDSFNATLVYLYK